MNYVKNFLLVWALIALLVGGSYLLFLLAEAYGLAVTFGTILFIWSAIVAAIMTRDQNGESNN